MAEAAVPGISVADLKRRIDAGEGPVIVDVREPSEWAAGNLAALGARSIPLGEIERRCGEISAAGDVFVHCKAGGRSAKAVAFLRSKGIRAWNVEGGLLAWAREIDPSIAVA